MFVFLKNLLQNSRQKAFFWVTLSLIGVPLTSGCTTKTKLWQNKINFSQTQMPTQCLGWQKLAIKNSTRYYLLEKDNRLLVDLESHNLRGRQIGCWQ